MEPHAIMLVSCPDQRGIVAAVAAFVASHGGNVIDLQQHTSHTEATFFLRVAFELDGLDLNREAIAEAFAPVAAPFKMQFRIGFSDDRPKVAILASKETHCLADLLHRWRSKELAIDTPVVISNHPDHQSMAAWFEVPYHHVPIVEDDKAGQERQIQAVLEDHGISLVVLAKYMQILSGDFCRRWSDRMINIHHSFLPSFQGAKPYHQAYAKGVKLIGVTAHYATADLDEGPIIDQDVLRVSHRDDASELRRKGRDLEEMVLARAVRAHIEHRVLTYGPKTIVFLD